jgi:predicted nuclease of predicted toxin-antitoxin system
MRVLLDECLPRKLKRELSGHEVRTVPEAGWSGKKNGELLRLAEQEFDVFVTIDQNLRYQQNLLTVQLAIILMVAQDSRLQTLRPLMGEVQEALSRLKTGEVIQVGTRNG